MNDHWHEQIQRHLSGQSSDAEFAALQQELNEDAELRALYLDYVNLDEALGTAAGKSIHAENKPGQAARSPLLSARRSPQTWWWLAAAAACVALVAFLVLSKNRDNSQMHPDIAATIASTKNSIARLSIPQAASNLSWTSPTSSLLAPSHLPIGRPGDPGN